MKTVIEQTATTNEFAQVSIESGAELYPEVLTTFDSVLLSTLDCTEEVSLSPEASQDQSVQNEPMQDYNGGYLRDIVAVHAAGVFVVTAALAMGLFSRDPYRGLTEEGKRLQEQIDDWNRSGKGLKPTPAQQRHIEHEVTKDLADELKSLTREINKLEKTAKRSSGSKKTSAQKKLVAKQHKADQLTRKIRKKKRFFRK